VVGPWRWLVARVAGDQERVQQSLDLALADALVEPSDRVSQHRGGCARVSRHLFDSGADRVGRSAGRVLTPV